jgi:hypothetical protein
MLHLECHVIYLGAGCKTCGKKISKGWDLNFKNKDKSWIPRGPAFEFC